MTVLHCESLNFVSQFGFFRRGFALFPIAIKTGAAHARQFTHMMYAHFALRPHPVADFGVDGFLPASPLVRAVSSTLRKALSKKSKSKDCAPITRSRRAIFASSSSIR